MKIIGIDPGLSGAIAILENNTVLHIFDIPANVALDFRFFFLLFHQIYMHKQPIHSLTQERLVDMDQHKVRLIVPTVQETL